jgi:hypothetical protein
MQEELGVVVRPARRLWESVTPWRTHLAWWLTEIEPEVELVPNPDEVDSIYWLDSGEMLALAELLESNRHFLAALANAEFLLD